MKHFSAVTNHSPALHCKTMIKSPKPQQYDAGLQQPLTHLFLINCSIFREGEAQGTWVIRRSHGELCDPQRNVKMAKVSLGHVVHTEHPTATEKTCSG